MMMHDDSSDLADEAFTGEVGASSKNDLVQTLLTVPLLAGSAVAVFMMLPAKSEVSTVSRLSPAAMSVGYEGHDHKTRQQRVTLARMERIHSQERLTRLSRD